jgi:hypothetical protein
MKGTQLVLIVCIALILTDKRHKSPGGKIWQI